ncbi:uracil phosphoribosyltransferase [Fulvivirga lutimaris]|uniref:uracil phosphoribosyltransferase n=1 Tax=Fulvivirga lutimaris TaxID=1819566 RepID=UPI0012BC551D|nr:uracil phosphoribosyltransferase [Fulvivirga lutimaris]
MINILNHQASIANHFLQEMRDKDIQKDRSKFRHNLKKLGQVMAYEVSKSLNYKKETVETPLAKMEVEVLGKNPVIVAILRASMPFFDGFMDYYDKADAAFIGAYREEGDDISIKLDYLAAPELEGRTLIIVDPMLATGKSLIAAYNQLISKGLPSEIHFVSAVAAPEGIEYIAAHLKTNYTIWVASLDEKLNEDSYIVPGLGDAGDLSFGVKS